ncbi:hypothetical protein ES689_04970 [Frigoribacterium sp. ACAM 257]|uniref:hypothetical protein n=1 Tax=Frigoribacterium sp. ACAM 257 TaxID=2508998 RepID=UPI0011BA383B|nr:hypothetical protein [Frigoribacterium sp. ACAM 257]TWX40777.1 hypothetical protein ES689_04970 [Frigoribacterium sp. ACAM 257]
MTHRRQPRAWELTAWWPFLIGSGVVGAAVGSGLVLGSSRTVEASPAAVVVAGVLGAIAGVLVGLVPSWAGLRRRPRVSTVSDVRDLTGLPVVGVLPPLRRRDDTSGRGSTGRQRAAARDALAAVAELRGGLAPRRLLLVRPDDSTGTLSTAGVAGVDGALARAARAAGYHTAILEGDFDSRALSRPSTVHDDVLPEARSLDGAGCEHVPVPLDVAAAVLGGDTVLTARFLDEVSSGVDVVVALASEKSRPMPAWALSPHSDVVLLVAAEGRTTHEQLSLMHEQLRSRGVEPLGVLLCGSPLPRRRDPRADWRAADHRAPVLEEVTS